MCLQEAGRNRINMPSFFNCFLEQLGCETSNDVCLVGRSFQAWNPKLNILALDAIKWHHQKRLENIIYVPEYIVATIIQGRTQDLDLAKQKFETLTGHKNRC